MSFIKNLEAFRKLIANEETKELEDTMSETNYIREILKDIKK